MVGGLKMSETIAVGEGSRSESQEWKSLALKIRIGVLSLFLAAEFAFYLLVVPATSLVRVTVNGSATVGYDEVCAIAGISGNEKWFSFDLSACAGRLAMNPLFESVMVEKRFPDRVVIQVKERAPVAIAFGTLGSRTVPVQIDRNGVAFRVGELPKGGNLPLITGISFDSITPGVALHAKLKPLLAELADMESRNSVLLSSISEIKIEQKTYGGYDLVVFPVHTPVRVRTDKALNEDALQYMMLVLDVVQDLSLDVEEIDIRAGTVAYRVRGEAL
jgi:cell division protein FtsQ